MKLILSLFIVCLLATSVLGDCYMHNPRGSNNRLNEENTNRDNANRLCDTQNNGKGGYCWGPPMTFYEGSYLVVEWTAQHGCGNPRLECNIVIQYMCTSEDDAATVRIRDGTTTNTIPDDPSASQETDGNGDYVYGMHENWEYYQQCKTRNRNLGLFIADREQEGGLSVGRRSAIFTRQNNGGNRHGFECVEERDYYPYWHWAPWRDMAVLVEDEAYCSFYKEYSQNVKERNHCEDTAGTYLPASTEVECSSVSGTWVTDEAWGIDAPDCVKAGFSRENHLGNGLEAFAETYNGTIPTTEDACGHDSQCECVLRIRYNVSTTELDNSPYGSFTDYTSNLAASPVTQDPIVEQEGNGFKLAIDTSQFFRTFEDRSHVFYITNRPDGVPSSARIYNLNVRGKRGNIVQCYPSVEYDFVPEVLRPKVGDFIHFQWTGCDTNPGGNAGEGRAKTDRSNIVQVSDFNAAYPATDDWIAENDALFESQELRQRMAWLGQKDCPTYEELLEQNGGDENAVEQDERNCFLLNAAPAYFDGGAVKMNSTGTFYYMSTRNNNFSNRGQKAVIEVVNVLPTWAIALIVVGGVIFLGAVGLSGAMFYAKSHPHSGVAAALNKF